MKDELTRTEGVSHQAVPCPRASHAGTEEIMATATETVFENVATPKRTLDGDRWVQFPATWETYQSLCESRGEKSRPRYFYFDGKMTAVSPGLPHEGAGARLGGLIEDILVGLRIKAYPLGSVTLWRSALPRGGAEADETYYLSNVDRIRGKKKLVMGEDPAPDLVVEIVVSHPPDDALECYRLFGVREVWVVEDDELSILVLSANGRYEPSSTSACFPFLSAPEIAFWTFRQDIDDEIELRFQFRAWVSETLFPRKRLSDDTP